MLRQMMLHIEIEQRWHNQAPRKIASGAEQHKDRGLGCAAGFHPRRLLFDKHSAPMPPHQTVVKRLALSAAETAVPRKMPLFARCAHEIVSLLRHLRLEPDRVEHP